MINDTFKTRYDGIPFATFKRNHYGDKEISTFAHNHKEIEMLTVIDGYAKFYVDDNVFTAYKGDVVIVSPYTLHYTTFLPRSYFKHICICFDASLILKSEDTLMLESGKSVFKPIIKRKDADSEKITKHIIDACNAYENKEFGWESCVTGNLSIIYSLLAKNGYIECHDTLNKTGELCRNIIDYIEAHYKEDITSSDISMDLYMSAGYFCRTFKKLFGKRFMNYLSEYRIEKAKTLLKQSELQVSEIAFECGFNGFSYFSETFKALSGKTPSEYRKFVAK